MTLHDFIERVANVGRRLNLISQGADPDLEQQCNALLTHRGEATGLARARAILDGYEALDEHGRRDFLLMMLGKFGVDVALLNSATAQWQLDPSDAAARALQTASRPRSHDLILRLNRAPGGTRSLVSMREDLLRLLTDLPELKPLDDDFQHFFRSWFNRGFLELKRIDWTTSAQVLEKIIQYEAVHEIDGWDDLRQRVAAKDRRLYAFFHPALDQEPLIFVEIALTRETPRAVGPILSRQRQPLEAAEANTAVFYSISNCQTGLRGVSFGNFLIKQVVEDLQREYSNLTNFVTLSPLPGFRRWVEDLPADEWARYTSAVKSGALTIENLSEHPDALLSLAVHYLARVKSDAGFAQDPVAHFHLGNGARLEDIHAGADLTEKGQATSFGLMANYLYNSDFIEQNHEHYVQDAMVICSSRVQSLLNRIG